MPACVDFWHLCRPIRGTYHRRNMDEKVERAGLDLRGDPLEQAVISSAERLATRVAVLRAQVRALVPEDQGRPPHAGGRLVELQARTEDLEGLKAAGAVIEAARVAAEARAEDAERRLALVEEDLRARLAELSRLRFRCEWFEKDLDTLAAEVALATAGAVRATRLEKERDEARDRAFTERQFATQDRERAAEAERRAIQLQHELETAQGQLVNVTEFNRRIEAVRESPRVLESIGTPWVELQHQVSASADAPPAGESQAGSVVEGTDGTEIVDLTEAEAAVGEQAPEEPVSSAEHEPSGEPISIDRGGLLRRLRSRRRPEPEPEGWPSSRRA